MVSVDRGPLCTSCAQIGLSCRRVNSEQCIDTADAWTCDVQTESSPELQKTIHLMSFQDIAILASAWAHKQVLVVEERQHCHDSRDAAADASQLDTGVSRIDLSAHCSNFLVGEWPLVQHYDWLQMVVQQQQQRQSACDLQGPCKGGSVIQIVQCLHLF